MNNNDILIRLRYALDSKDSDMIKIFHLGGIDISKEELHSLLTKQEDEDAPRDERCSDRMLEQFLNGLITFKRGKQPAKKRGGTQPMFLITSQKNVNNVMIKKIKIALSLTSDDVLDALRLAGVYASDSELGAILRKEGHRNYKQCGDRYARNFLKGLAIKYRNI